MVNFLVIQIKLENKWAVMRGQKWDGKNYGGWATYPWPYPGLFSQ